MLLQAAGRSCQAPASCSPRVTSHASPPCVPHPQPAGRRGAWRCYAEAGPDGRGLPQIVNGPISYNPMQLPVSDSVTAGSAKPPVDRSKGLWTRCDKCGVILYIKHLRDNNHICFGCQHHLKMSSMERVDHLIDANTWRPMDETLSPVDPLEFVDQKAYTDRIKDAQAKTGLQDAVRTGTGLMHGVPVALGVMDFSFMGGSMGSVVGEKLTRLIEYATCEGLSVIIVSTSGGARMQEGIMSLMQMAKISGALHVHQTQANLLFISLLTSPTTGGVTASFGMLGDIIIAEPQAIIGFAGRRVIEQTLQEDLPDNFQTAEYLMEHGLLDLVVPRPFLKGALYEIIHFYKDAPFKRRGAITFGVQHGTYLTTEERIRRKWFEWSDSLEGHAPGGGNGHAAAGGNGGTPDALAEANGADTTGAAATYRELVRSFETLVAGVPALPGGDAAAASTDVRDLLGNEVLLSEAMNVARGGRMDWVQIKEERGDAERQFMFRVIPDPAPASPAAAPVSLLVG